MSQNVTQPAPFRSVLTVPASNVRALDKASGLACDAVIFDLEDSVSPEKKAEARQNLVERFRSGAFAAKHCIIRINGLDTPFGLDDLACVAQCKPAALLLPKVERPSQLQDVRDWLDEQAGLDDLALWAMIETPKGILNAAAMAEAGRGLHLTAFVVGLNDLRLATRIAPDPARTFVVPLLMQVILAARAYDLLAIDAVGNDFTDLAAFAAECAQGKAMGFDGKMLIHPAQIAPANRAFGPSLEAIARAEAIITAFADPSAAGQGAVNLNGEMIERLHLHEAERLVAMAQTLDHGDQTP